MSHQIITRAERIKLFFREYYTSNNVWLNTMRIIGGPLVIGCGIHLYSESERFAIGYGGFCFLYGIYYTLKPVLIVAIRSSLFQAVSFNLHINKEELTIQEEGASTTIQFDLFKRILRHSKYYSVKLPEKMTIYFKENLLDEQEKAILDQHLRA
jgi:hypothetical protein